MGIAAAAMLGVFSAPATGQSFPARPIRIIVGTGPGGGADIVARLLAARLQEQFGSPVIVENRAGASGAIAADQVARAAPDGHTLLFGFAAQMVVNPVIQAGTAYDPIRDFEPISMLGLLPGVLVANAALPAGSVRDLVHHARANPGRLNYASGASSYLVMTEAFKQMTGTDIRAIPFTGSAQAVAAVLAGTVDIAFVDLPPAIAHLRSGRLKALAVTTARRVEALPDVPALAETVAGYEFVLWTALFAPARTPMDVVARLNQEVGRAVDAPETKERMIATGVIPVTGSAQDLGQTVRRYLDMVRRFVKPPEGPAK